MYIKFIYLYYHNANILPIILAIHFHFLNSDQVEIYEIYDNTIVFYYHAMSMQIPLHHCKCLPKLKIILIYQISQNYLNNYKKSYPIIRRNFFVSICKSICPNIIVIIRFNIFT